MPAELTRETPASTRSPTQRAESADGVPAPPAASGELRKCETCNKRAGACLSPGEEGHLKWREAYCPKCFTKPNAKGCKLLDRDGHWTIAAAATAMAECSLATADSPSGDGQGEATPED